MPITRKFPTVPVKANRPSRLTYGIAIAGCDVISAGSTPEAFGMNGKSMVRLYEREYYVGLVKYKIVIDNPLCGTPLAVIQELTLGGSAEHHTRQDPFQE